MARLSSTTREQLPNSAFAYVDTLGRRKLPIHDEARVRNALARFNRVVFEDERARERARARLLNAAKKYRIVPVGFITGQLQSEREIGELRSKDAVQLPSGFLTMLMTDVEGSTALVQRLGDRYGELINDVRTILRDAALETLGQVVETRADEFFAVFERPRSALDAAVTIQRRLRQRSWADDLDVLVRVGIHSGYPTINDANYIGMAVHTTARVCEAAHGGQILVSGDTRQATKGMPADGLRFRSLGDHRLRGLPNAVPLFQVTAKGLPSRFPQPRTSSGRVSCAEAVAGARGLPPDGPGSHGLTRSLS
ncbi:MAG: adenylate/guanylate cyclase domain-containing protein [Acidimicrobiales bacterium]